MLSIYQNHRSRARQYLALSVVFILGLYCFIPSSTQTSTLLSSTTTSSRNQELLLSNSSLRDSDISKINNATLGFAKIYTLNLPYRTDKRDAMDLSASLTNLTLTWRDGVNGSTLNPKAIPPKHDSAGEFSKDGEVGCWRGHMNIMREIVTSGVGSALVLEDDADWDINIRRQMEQLAMAARETVGLLPEAQRNCGNGGWAAEADSPYGDCWDILWIGHCGGWPPSGKFHGYQSVITRDKTVPPIFDVDDLTRDIVAPCAAHIGKNLKTGAVCGSPALQADERIVQYKGSPICTTGYAISQKGARKMMARLGGLSLTDVDANLDTEMTELCRGEKDGEGNKETMQCLSVAPPLIVPHRRKGSKSADSDISLHGHEAEVREMGVSKGIMYSTRLNTEALIKGENPFSQYVYDERSERKWRYRQLEEYGTF